jgi:hypothetical protein
VIADEQAFCEVTLGYLQGICLCTAISYSYFMGSKTKKIGQESNSSAKHNKFRSAFIISLEQLPL